MHPSQDLATSFGGAADAYDRARPGYPGEVVDWLLDDVEGRVVDVGAGTGKLTTALAARRDVVAVEPDDAMRAVLARRLLDVPAAAGSAESIPVDDATAGLVTFAQAWHWVDVAAACQEVARVLTRPGRLGLVWNYRDDSDDWARRLGEVMGGADSAGKASDIRASGPELAAPFQRCERQVVTWDQPTDVDTVVDLAASRSYVIVRPAAERRAVLDDVRRLAEERAAADGSLVLPYVTYAYRSDLTP